MDTTLRMLFFNDLRKTLVVIVFVFWSIEIAQKIKNCNLRLMTITFFCQYFACWSREAIEGLRGSYL